MERHLSHGIAVRCPCYLSCIDLLALSPACPLMVLIPPLLLYPGWPTQATLRTPSPRASMVRLEPVALAGAWDAPHCKTKACYNGGIPPKAVACKLVLNYCREWYPLLLCLIASGPTCSRAGALLFRLARL